VHIVFLLHLRSVLIVTLPLPLAVLAAFLGMRYAGISANIMSLSGNGPDKNQAAIAP
jgi:Cu(I)/Ag(I) efflux system membrane protein CusA/SilA